LVIEVIKDGPACHKGTDSCFTQLVSGDTAENDTYSFKALYDLLVSRKELMPESSYTTYLFEKGLDKILKKIGEETTEVIIGAKNSKEETVYEIADLAYHVLVLMVEMGISVDEIRDELASRHVIEHKVKQEKMK
jgi:phosphoribosyl-ATP pyrophosphohydrolase/phosphoribosyl-AMP cyclohydrolase